jgi:hypothetical protein
MVRIDDPAQLTRPKLREFACRHALADAVPTTSLESYWRRISLKLKNPLDWCSPQRDRRHCHRQPSTTRCTCRTCPSPLP